ncbi:reverse transcriptase domain-containing protein [Tanacetum coccineum]
MKKKTCKNKNKNIQKEFVKIEVLKSSTQYYSAYEATILNISEVDVEHQPDSPLQEMIILDPDDQPMWESAKIVAQTPNYAVISPDVDDNFVINSTHLKMIQKNKFDGYRRVDPHDHIREFLCMRTRSQARNRNRRQQQLTTVIVEEPEFPMADNRTMAQMLQAPIEGYEDAIVVPTINANNFELKQTLIFQQGEARTWLDKEPPRSILTWDDLVSKFINQFFPPSKTTYLRNEITTFYQKPNETFNEAWERFKGLLRQCPHHGFSELHQLDTFYNSLNTNDQDALDSAAGGNFLDKMPRDGLAIIESKSKVRYSRSRAIEPRILMSPKTNWYQSKFHSREDESVERTDKPLVSLHRPVLKMFKQLRLEIGLKDALVEMPKFNKWLSSLLRNKEKLEEIAITTVNAECSAIIMNKVPEKLEDPGKFLIPCALQELDRTSALADSGASINLVPSFYLHINWLEALILLVMTLRACNRRPFLRTAKALIDLYEETLTLRIGKEELVYYADKSKKNKDKHFVHAISIIDFSKDDPFSGSTTIPSDAPFPSSSPMKTSDSTFEEFINEFTLPNSLPPGDDVSIHKKDIHEETFSNPLFEFDDNFKSSNVNPLFEENDKDVEIKSSSSFTLTSPEESEFEAYLERDSIPPGIDLTLPPTLEVSSSNPTSPTLTGEKDHSWKMSMFFSLILTRLSLRELSGLYYLELLLRNEGHVYKTGTDISKITRKPPKTGKHGHGKRKSTREAKDSKPKPEKVKLQSNGQTSVKESQTLVKQSQP